MVPGKPAPPPLYRAIPVLEDGRLIDVRLEWPDKSWRLCGRVGARLEEDLVARALAGDDGQGLPVLLGLGLGHGLRKILRERPGPVAVADREEAILTLTRDEELAENPRVFFVAAKDLADPDRAMEVLEAFRTASGGGPFLPVAHPVYLRLPPGFYAALSRRLASHNRFWGAAGYRKFTHPAPRVLLFESRYFLVTEIREALAQRGAAVLPFPAPGGERGQTGFVEELLAAVVEFKPDFILTVNHLGLDRDGALTGLLERLRLPLASWFVDNPHLILHDYAGLVSPWCMLFSWDADLTVSLRTLGFSHTAYLPLATDPRRFAPPASHPSPTHPWRADVSFVGASMRAQVDAPLSKLAAWPELVREYASLARAFRRHPERGVRAFLAEAAPEVHAAWLALPTAEARLDFEMLVTWEATRQYRLERVERLVEFSPLIVGDAGWEEALPGCGRDWRRLDEIGYYEDLPRFYPASRVNFNCTSVQMKGAVNQRVFDVPACGAFLLTDRREQLAALFEEGREVVCYGDPFEIPELVRHYLANPAERERVAQAARARILAEHTYEHRVETLCAAMRRVYG